MSIYDTRDRTTRVAEEPTDMFDHPIRDLRTAKRPSGPGAPHGHARRLRRLLACFGLVPLLTHCATAPAPTQPPEAPRLVRPDFALPPFYRVDGPGDTELLLLGTIHVGPQSGWRFSPALLDGVARADRLVLEIDLRRATEDAVSTLLARLVILEPPDELLDVVSPETARLLDEHDGELTRLGMPANARRRLKPWYIATGLVELAAHQSGYSGSESVENFLMHHLGERPLDALETWEEQLAMLDGLSWEEQDVMLRDAVLKLDSAVVDVRELVRAWQLGDEVAIERFARAGSEELPALESVYQRLGPDRNRDWMPALEEFLEGDAHATETILVAVGAYHLVGEEGLVALLRRAGYSVESIDHFGVEETERR